jgi:Creatinine amidohydrolase
MPLLSLSRHGGEAETSAMLSVRSDLVDMKNAPEKIIPKLPPNIRIYWRFNELTQTGATGAPRKTTRAKGDKILEVLLFGAVERRHCRSVLSIDRLRIEAKIIYKRGGKFEVLEDNCENISA